ncbi:MAG TPA: RNA 2'-phosphotransferase [Pyrinomonadaceae bacterium]
MRNGTFGEVALIKKDRAISISKYMSLVLRHDPAAAGVMLDAEGWVSLREVCMRTDFSLCVLKTVSG